ncbi:MAG: hypothetical protein KJZ85_15015 [Rhodobacteraceae bacterium]|jgi:hypothetical protein|nr:hypothetical protein [Paracoccaceae bacterium]
MGHLVWAGAAVTLAGVGVLVWCILAVARARRAGLDEAGLRARLQRLVAVNLAALLLSAVGLMLVVAGVLLG